MKVLCIIDSIGSGGAQRQLVSLAKYFKQKGMDVDMLSYHPHDFYLKDMIQSGINYECLQETNYIKRIIKFRRKIRKGGYDVVLSFLTGANLLAEIASIPFKKFILIVGERNANNKIVRSYKQRFFRVFHLFADYIVSNSNANINLVKRANPLLSNEKFKVIRNSVNPDLFDEYNSSKKSKNQLNIIVGSSHIKRKNLKGLLLALHRLTSEEQSMIHIKWFGDKINPPYFDNSFPEGLELLNQYDLKSTIDFFPATHNFINEIKNADIVGLFSTSEGIPNVICEAMALGKPVIVANISDMKEILPHADLQLFELSDSNSLSNKLRILLSLEKTYLSEIGQANKVVATREFDFDTNANLYFNLFK